ncbi:MAG TPA: M1 family aminopeptidase [Candidatus Angelobacter sp.]
MTKVLLGCTLAAAQAVSPAPALPSASVTYGGLLNPVVTASDVHQIRDVSIQREDVHLTLSDGTIGLMRAVDGHVTGAVFEGVGEVLVVPPNRAERTSLALFTGSAVLEQKFTSAYFRFFDDALVDELRSGLRPAEDASEFLARWEQTLKLLAPSDSLEILEAMTNAQDPESRFVLFRLGGTQLGTFDVVFNGNAAEQIRVSQERLNGSIIYYDSWVSFPMRSAREAGQPSAGRLTGFESSDYKLRAQAQPPTDLSVEGEVTLTPRRSGQRAVMLELSRYLRLSQVSANGQPAEFIQNEAVSGSELARRGDDRVVVIFPAAVEKDRPIKLSFAYSGPVMFNAGGEVLYVGARGTWYPTAGPSYASFDLTFDYPEDWSLAATGTQVSSSAQNGRRVSHFVTEKPITHAGFNLGRFETGEAKAGNVVIRAHAAKTVEQVLAEKEAYGGMHPKPAREVQQIAAKAASTVQFLSAELDAFPYSHLEITQLPALLSQSWPGLIYLSSMAFLDQNERVAAGIHDPYTELLLSRLMLAHETAHQWWGDAVDWASYRDEWIIEAVANYCALIMLEKEDPQATKIALDYYKSQLLKETPDGIVGNAGAVTLGARLTSSRFPQGYERVLYGRGTWLIHMLRMMLRQAGGQNNDALFFAALKGLLAKSPGHKISTRDLQLAFEQVLPESLNYEGKKSLDWFFDSWVNDVSIPQFSLEGVHVVAAGDKAQVSGTIRESHAAKDLVTAVPIYAVGDKGEPHFLAFVFADEAETTFTLTAPAGTKELLLDPEGTLLRR